MRKWVQRIAAALALTVLVSPPAMAQPAADTALVPDPVLGAADAITGDLLDIHSIPVRLFGIYAPQGVHHCGADKDCIETSREALARLIKGRLVICYQEYIDRNGYPVARCYADGIDLSDSMVRSGHALAHHYYSLEYVEAEQNARMDARGIWQAGIRTPWEW